MDTLLNLNACYQINSRCTRIGLSHCQCLIFCLEAMEAHLRDVNGMWLALRCHSRWIEAELLFSKFEALPIQIFTSQIFFFWNKMHQNSIMGKSYFRQATAGPCTSHQWVTSPWAWSPSLWGLHIGWKKGCKQFLERAWRLVAGCSQQQKHANFELKAFQCGSILFGNHLFAEGKPPSQTFLPESSQLCCEVDGCHQLFLLDEEMRLRVYIPRRNSPGGGIGTQTWICLIKTIH